MKIALLGFGVVGSGVYKIISAQDCGLTVKRALTRRPRPEMGGLVTTQFEDILNDPEIELVAEAMGGVDPALRYVLAALNAGKHVVTANKQLVCCHFRELAEAAKANNVQLRYSASAGGGIPWLFNLLRVRRADEITAIEGCINGTSNFILGAMTRQGADFGTMLAEAQALGYAEADPSADIDGMDLQRKCAISASLAFGAVVAEEDVLTAGIRHITAGDVEWARSRELVFKPMMRCARAGGAISAYVEPTLLPQLSPEASLPIRSSIATLSGKYIGRMSFFGAGAGTLPTGMNMVQDALDICAHIGEVQSYATDAAVDNAAQSHRYYVRTTALDRLAKLDEQGEGWAVTAPIPVAAMHARVAEIREIDPQIFFAGLKED